MPTLYFDLASPYAYLAVARACDVLGCEPVLEPILLGALFPRRGHGSWAHTGERDRNVAEIERRVRRYGLPPLVWPREWPVNSLAAMRAATWAKQHGSAAPFARAAYGRHFAHGADIADVAVLEQVADSVGLPGASCARPSRAPTSSWSCERRRRRRGSAASSESPRSPSAMRSSSATTASRTPPGRCGARSERRRARPTRPGAGRCPLRRRPP
jgi:2-hydroxychromene-2-carboxylate isomerase